MHMGCGRLWISRNGVITEIHWRPPLTEATPEASFDATPEVAELRLPLLPPTTGVVWPQMVVTLALESAEGRDAADGATAGDRRILLVPRVGTGYTRIRTVARIENEGELPGGQRALVLRGLS